MRASFFGIHAGAGRGNDVCDRRSVALIGLVLVGCMSADKSPEENERAYRAAERAAQATKWAADVAAGTGTPWGALAGGILGVLGAGLAAWNHSRVSLLMPSPLEKKVT